MYNVQARLSLKQLHVWVVLIAVLAISFGAAWLLPVNDLFKGFASTPGVAALIAVLYQLIRDEAAYERQLEIQQEQQVFSLGAMSHMANVTFDKHVLFCERYIAEVDSVIRTLFREGPTKDALGHAANLASIRREFSAWITDSINEQLEPFEQELRNLGAATGFVVSTQDEPDYDRQRRERVEIAWEKFNKILTIKGEAPDETVAVETVKSKIRQILGIDELVELRQRFIQNARTLLG